MLADMFREIPNTGFDEDLEKKDGDAVAAVAAVAAVSIH